MNGNRIDSTHLSINEDFVPLPLEKRFVSNCERTIEESNFIRKFAFIRTRMWTHSLVYIHFLILSILVNSLGERNFLAKREWEKRRKSRGCAIYREVLSDLRGEVEGADFRIDEPANNLRSLSGRVEAIYRRLACFQRAVCVEEYPRELKY